MDRFPECLETTLTLEGGYILHDVPGDRGGMTYAGISSVMWPDLPLWQDLDALRAPEPSAELRAAVEAFYREQFWEASGARDMLPPLDLSVFDCAVNCGLKSAGRYIQETVGVEADGVVGQDTLAAMEAKGRTPATLALIVCLRRAEKYAKIVAADETQAQFLGGWYSRIYSIVDEILAYAPAAPAARAEAPVSAMPTAGALPETAGAAEGDVGRLTHAIGQLMESGWRCEVKLTS